MDNDADIGELDDRIKREQFRLLAAHLPVVLPASLLAAVLVGWGFWGRVESWILFSWLACLLLLAGARTFMSRWFMKHADRADRYWQMKWFLLTGAALSGIVWGAAGVFFFDPDDAYGFAFLVIILGGLLAGALGSHSYYFPSFVAFAVPEFVPLIWEFSHQEGEMYTLIMLVMLLFLSLNLYYSKKYEDMVVSSIRLRFANDSLLNELRASNRELHQHSYTDPLTGIGNRRQFDLDMEQTWQVTETTGARVCLILMDVDHFKAYNDEFGHPQGDRVLQEIARVMLRVCEEHKVRGRPMRIGGEEFALLLKGDLEKAREIAEIMRQAVRNLSGEGERITASFGVAMVCPVEGGTRKMLFQSADQALYQAKAGGRDRVVVFDGQEPPNPS